jgi:arylsulfatase A-like enzyme
MMRDGKYHHAYFGKWHLGDEVVPQHGFQEWSSIHFSLMADPATGQREAILSDYEKFLIANNQKPDRDRGRVFSPRFESNLPIELSKPRFLQERACDYLRRHQQEPFVLFVAFFEPHPPYNGPLNNSHPLDQLSLDATADQTFGSDLPLRYRALQAKWHEVYGKTREKRLSIKGNYLGLVTEVDQSIGAILATLEQLDLTDKTIVMHAADHGDMMTAHGLFGKSVMFEEAARIPWLVHLPGQSKSLSISQPVSTIDFVPTILDLLGQPPHPQCVGKSLAPLIHGENVAPENVFSEWHPSRRREDPPKHMGFLERFTAKQAMAETTRAVISPDGWKLCRRDADVNELYNLKADPGELLNLYSHSANQEVVHRLSDDLHRWQERLGDKAKV